MHLESTVVIRKPAGPAVRPGIPPRNHRAINSIRSETTEAMIRYPVGEFNSELNVSSPLPRDRNLQHLLEKAERTQVLPALEQAN